MKIYKVKKRRKYRTGNLLILCLFILMPVAAQNVETDTLSVGLANAVNHEKQIAKTSVLLGAQEPATLIQSVSTVSGDRLLHRPAFQMEQFLDGTLPGLYVNLTNGYPTQNLGLQMRQRNLMIVVDGVPRADANIPASQIESVSLIKDGLGLAAWGTSSGDGVLYIKTKRGNQHKLKIDFTAQYATAQQIFRPQFLSAHEYADLFNKAEISDGKDPSAVTYTERDIELYRTGESPYTHPNNDWYKILLRDHSPIQQYNLNMSGGSALAEYFIDLNMFDQQGFLKQDKSVNAYDTRESFKKWSLRTNVNVNLTKNTIFNVGLFGQMYRENTPGRTMMSEIYSKMNTVPANAYPIYNPAANLYDKGAEVTFGGTPDYGENIYAMANATGYIQYPQTDLNFDLSLEHHFEDALKGFYVKGLYSYNSAYREIKGNVKGFDMWQYRYTDPAKAEDDPSNYTKLITGATTSKSSSYSRQYRLQYLETALGYDCESGLHSLKSGATYWENIFVTQTGSLPMYKYGVNIHAAYDYDRKYMAEITLAANGLNYLKPGHKWGFFPAAGLGWNISREDFFRSPQIDNLKLRATLGLNGNDGTGSFFRSATGVLSNYFTYIPVYTSGGSVILGQTASSYSTLVESGLAYEARYDKTLRFVAGVDAEVFDKSVTASAEYFYNYHFDVLALDLTKDYNSLLGTNPSMEHFAAFNQQGVELNISYQKQFGDFSLLLNPQATFYTSKWLKMGEPEYPNSYMQRTGTRYYGYISGYVAEVFFTSQEDIDRYLDLDNGGYDLAGYTPKPGDLKYKDLNGDHIIDAQDVQEISTKAPRIEYGFYFNLGWKGLALSMQWTGLANSQAIYYDFPFSKIGNAYGQALRENLDYWTPDNPDATYPRLSLTDNSWNTKNSTFWLRNTGYLRLKNIELSYSLPQSWTKAIKISGIKVFANAYNALTISSLKNIDPELMSSTTVPNFKAYNFGLNVQF